MSRAYKFGNQDKLHFVTFTVVRWIDVFTRRQYKEILLDSLRYAIANKGMELYAWVIMSNHVHLIIGTTNKPLQDIVRDMKRHTSKTILKAIQEETQESRKDWLIWFFEREGKVNTNNEHYQFWQQGSHPIELNTNEILDKALNYLHQNPVKAGWVDIPEDFLYSSARDYAGRKGLVENLMLIG